MSHSHGRWMLVVFVFCSSWCLLYSFLSYSGCYSVFLDLQCQNNIYFIFVHYSHDIRCLVGDLCEKKKKKKNNWGTSPRYYVEDCPPSWANCSKKPWEKRPATRQQSFRKDLESKRPRASRCEETWLRFCPILLGKVKRSPFRKLPGRQQRRAPRERWTRPDVLHENGSRFIFFRLGGALLILKGV